MSSETRKSQIILKGLVQKKNYSRSDSVSEIYHISNLTKNKENSQKRCKTSCGITLNQLGLPYDAFDEVVLQSNRREFQKSVEDLNRNFPVSSDFTNIDLKYLKRTMEKELNSFLKNQNHIDKSIVIFDDEEICKINENRANLDLSKKFRSSSALSSKIPTPIKQPLVERPKSKMELRIQRKLSLDTSNQISSKKNNNNSNSQRQYQRRNSDINDICHFEECF